MASTRGSRADNPVMLHDDEVQEVARPDRIFLDPGPQVVPNSGAKKAPAYYELDDDEDSFISRPASEIPESARNGPKKLDRKNGKSNRRSTPGSAVQRGSRPREHRPHERLPGDPRPQTTRPQDRRPHRSPPDQSLTHIEISSDDDEPAPARHASRASSTIQGPSSPVSSLGNRKPGSASARLPQRFRSQASPGSRLSPSKANSLTQPKAKTPTVGEEQPELSDEGIGQMRRSASSSVAEKPQATRNVTPAVTQESVRETQHMAIAQAGSDLQSRPSPHQQSPSPKTASTPTSVQPNEMVQNSADVPIGISAESEQTTSKHVETNATSTFERASAITEAEQNVASGISERASGSRTREPQPLHKPNAIKRAVSPPRHKAQSLASPAQPARPSPRQNSGTSFVNNSHEGPSLDRQLKNTSAPPIDDVSRADMGAQVSAAVIAPSEQVLDGVHEEVLSSHPAFESTNASRKSVEASGELAEPTSPNVGDDESIPPIDLLDNEEARAGNLNRQEIESHLTRRLDERFEDHAYFVKNTMWRQRTCFERELRAESRGNTTKKKYQLPKKYIQHVSPFAKMKAIQVPLEKGHNNKEISQEIFPKTSKDPVIKSSWSVPTTKYRIGGVHVPSFKEYVSLKANILADNESKLMTLPYLGDADDKKTEEAQEALVLTLPTLYEIRHDVNAMYDIRMEQCRFYTESVNDFLTDIGITWDALLYWLLLPAERLKHAVGYTQGSSDIGLLDRSAFESDEFQRDGKKKAILFAQDPDLWRDLLSQLKALSVEEIRTAALVCAAIFTHCNLSPWYMVSQCETMRNHVKKKTLAAQSTRDFSFRKIVCRVCHTHNCLSHGQIRERPHSDDESSDTNDKKDGFSTKIPELGSTRPNGGSDRSPISSPVIQPAHYDDDSDVENIINYRLAVNPEVLANDAVPEFDVSKAQVPPPGPWKTSWWLKQVSNMKWEKRKPFVPCHHEGSCIQANCRCFREGVTCEKSCRCLKTCNRRFPGCRCASMPGKRVCGTMICLCVKFNRECDADLCATCGATEILDPVNRYDGDVLTERCTNVGIQRGVPKKTLLGQSEVHGFGLYTGQDIVKDDIIGEYTGELISTKESNRRASMYEYQNTMYLFKLNKEQEVDATYMGNKLRFINNANQNLTNCYPKVLLCNTVFRVAIYAATNLKAGTELFFHYNYPEHVTRHFKQPRGTGKVVAVKHAAKPKSKISYKPPGGVEKPWVHAATAKARAAKAEKREFMLAQGLLPVPKAQKQARKSVGGSHMLHKQSDSRSSSRAPTRGLHDLASEDNDGVSNLVVQDSDSDSDTDFEPTQEEPAEVVEDPDSERQYGNIAPRTNKPPARLRKSAPSSMGAFVAIWKTRGGARLAAGRKRKRLVVVNSEDEV